MPKNFNIIMSDDVDAMLSEVEKELNTNRSDVLSRIFTLYNEARKAKQDGMHIGFAKSPENLDVRITGI